MRPPIDNTSLLEGTAVLPTVVEDQRFVAKDGFLVSSPWIDDKTALVPNRDARAIRDDQTVPVPSTLFQPLRQDVSNLNVVRVQSLQRWTGRVERVRKDSFTAIIRDMTTHENPAEEVELEIQDVSRPDRSLVVPGAIFYWAIVYRDRNDGSRERVTTMRFARQPKITETDIEEIFKEADKMAELLQSA